MARIQVLPLPSRTCGSFSETPYVLIIDQAVEGEFVEGIDETLSAATGARTVLVTDRTLDVA